MDICLCSNHTLGKITNPSCSLHGGPQGPAYGVPQSPAFGTPMWYERKIRELESRNETLELVVSCAKDVLEFWPQLTFRTIRVMIPKMDSLKQALEMLK